MSFSQVAQIGPDVGEIVSFDPRNGPRYWSQPGIPALAAPSGRHEEPARNCVLMPSVMAQYGGSLVIEAKELSHPPTLGLHWSGSRTEIGVSGLRKVRRHDVGTSFSCGRWPNAPGGYGAGHLQGLF